MHVHAHPSTHARTGASERTCTASSLALLALATEPIAMRG